MELNPEGKLGDASFTANLSSNEQEVGNSSSDGFSVVNKVSLRLDVPLKDRFRVLLDRIGRSQNWLADKCDVSKGTMSKIVNGDWFPSTKLMERICENLEVQSHVVFGDSEHWKHYQENIVYSEESNE